MNRPTGKRALVRRWSPADPRRMSLPLTDPRDLSLTPAAPARRTSLTPSEPPTL
jgi:hypothetical protein